MKYLDAHDVVVSKLKRFSALDADDIRAVCELEQIDPQKLTNRFQSAVDSYQMDARSEDIPKYIETIKNKPLSEFCVV